METRRPTRHRLLAGLAAPILLLAACGDGDDAIGAASDNGGGGGSRRIFITGSSTVEPISSLVADELNASGSDIQVDVEGPGTGDGFELFCNGEADIADASRPIKDEEVALCDANGVEYVELEIAFDGIAVLTSAANDRVGCLTTADLYALLGPESEGFDAWSDALHLASALGSDTELPDAELVIAGPGTESGTYDAFIELAFGDPAEARLESGDITEEQVETLRTDYASYAEDNSIIADIEGSDTSLGWVGFAFAEGAGDAVRTIAVDAGDGCVEPTLDTIADGSYPLSRSLFLYVSLTAMEDNPAVAEYVDFYLDDAQLRDVVVEAGYVPLPAERIEATRDAWAARG